MTNYLARYIEHHSDKTRALRSLTHNNVPFIWDANHEKEFKNFTSKWNFTHITSSPNFPQSNGLSERAVPLDETDNREGNGTQSTSSTGTEHSKPTPTPVTTRYGRVVKPPTRYTQ